MEILGYAWSLSRLCRGWVICHGAALGFVMALGSCLAAASPDEPIDEYQVKAAFIFNFAKFVQWPAGTFQSSIAPIAICVPGQDPFGRALKDTVAGRAIDGRSLFVRHISRVNQAARCQVLFIGAAESKRSLPLLSEFRTPGVLTIGESDDSAVDGVVINFRLQGGKVRFDINVEAAEREKLRISSRLLSLAHIVGRVSHKRN